MGGTFWTELRTSFVMLAFGEVAGGRHHGEAMAMRGPAVADSPHVWDRWLAACGLGWLVDEQPPNGVVASEHFEEDMYSVMIAAVLLTIARFAFQRAFAYVWRVYDVNGKDAETVLEKEKR